MRNHKSRLVRLGVKIKVVIFVLCLFLGSAGFASPAWLTYQGRIVKSDGTPLEYSNVSFIFQITSPSGLCVIYQEQVTGLNMAGTKGVFDVPIGTGTVAWPSGGGFSVLEAFNNSSTFTCGSCSGYSCSAGTGSYGPLDTDGRVLKVQFYDGNGWKAISPNTVIRSVPFAAYSLSAQKLGSHDPSSFVFKNDINSNASCDGGSQFLTWNALTKTFGCSGVSGTNGGTVTTVTAASPLSVAAGTESSTPHISIPAASGSQNGYLTSGDWTVFNNKLGPATTFGGDVSGTASNLSVDKIKNVPVSFAGLSANDILKYSGGTWVNAALTTAEISGLSTALSAKADYSQFPTTCTAAQTLTFISPIGGFTCTNIALPGSQVSGNIAGTAAGFTGSLGGDVTGTQGATYVSKIQGVNVTATAPTLNQVLKYDGSQWAPMSLSTSDLPTGTLSGSGTAGYVPYYSAANTLANSVLYQSGGNVGVGTTNPSYKLSIESATTTSNVGVTGTSAASTQAAGLAFSDTSSPSKKWFYSYRGPNYTTSNQTDHLIMHYTPDGTNYHPYIQYLPNNAANGSAGNVNFVGNVGIGTAVPTARLDITHSGSVANDMPVLTLRGTQSGGDIGANTSLNLDFVMTDANTTAPATPQARISAKPGGAGNGYHEEASGQLIFSTAFSSDSVNPNNNSLHEHMRITHTGNVGIGTTAPTTKLEVAGTVKATAFEGPMTATTSSTGAGSASAPSMTFSGDNDTGFYNTSSNNTISVAAGGANIFNFNSLGLVSPTSGGASVSTAAGTAGAPTFSFAGDTDTGWFSPAADTLAAATAGAERVRIDSAGNVGVGTSSPLRSLHIETPSGRMGVFKDDSSGPHMAEEIMGRLDFGLEAGGHRQNVASVAAISETSITTGGGFNHLVSGALGFYTFPTTSNLTSDSAVPVERMRINRNGNIGIGTTNPTGRLSVRQSLTNGNTFGAGQGSEAGLTIGNTSSIQDITGLTIATGGKGDSAANLGWQFSLIGTNTYYDFATDSLKRYSTSGGFLDSQAITMSADAASRVGGNRLSFWTGSNGDPSERMVITGNGNVGIGTTSPGSKLHVANGGLLLSASANDAFSSNIRFDKDRAGGATQNGDELGYLSFRGHDGSAVIRGATIVAKQSGAASANSLLTDLIFATNAGTADALERMRITSSGNVGIGTTTPSYLLTVSNGTFHKDIAIQPAQDTVITDRAALRTGSSTWDVNIDSLEGLNINLDTDGNQAGAALRVKTGVDERLIFTPLVAGSSNLTLQSPQMSSSLFLSKADGNYSYIRASTSGLARWDFGSNNTAESGADAGSDFYIRRFNDAGTYLGDALTILRSNGHVGIGTTNPSYTLHVVGTAGLSTGTAWTNASDLRLKDIHGDYPRGLEEILQLHTVLYNYKKDNALGLPSDFTKSGFIAQEVQKVIPEAVSERKDGYLELNVDPIHWAVVNAVKELYHRWFSDSQELRREIASVKAENAELKERLRKIEESLSKKSDP